MGSALTILGLEPDLFADGALSGLLYRLDKLKGRIVAVPLLHISGHAGRGRIALLAKLWALPVGSMGNPWAAARIVRQPPSSRRRRLPRPAARSSSGEAAPRANRGKCAGYVPASGGARCARRLNRAGKQGRSDRTRWPATSGNRDGARERTATRLARTEAVTMSVDRLVGLERQPGRKFFEQWRRNLRFVTKFRAP